LLRFLLRFRHGEDSDVQRAARDARGCPAGAVRGLEVDVVAVRHAGAAAPDAAGASRGRRRRHRRIFEGGGLARLRARLEGLGAKGVGWGHGFALVGLVAVDAGCRR